MHFKKLSATFIFIMISTPSLAIEINILEPHLHPLPPHHQRPYRLYDIHPVMGQGLTIIKLMAKSIREDKDLTPTRGGPLYCTAVSFSKDWKLI